MRRFLAFVVAASMSAQVFGQGAPAPLHPPFSSSDARQIIAKLATELENNYVYPEIGRRYAAMLRVNLAGGRYSTFADSGAFAERVTADLQAVSPDQHLVLVAPRNDRPAGSAPSAAPPDAPPPIGKSGWIAPGVAYIEFRSFPSDKATLDKLRNFLVNHARARVLIIDTTNEFAGGWIGESDLLFSRLFAKSRDLLAVDIRKAVDSRMGGFPTGPTLRRIEMPDGVVRYVNSVVPVSGTALKKAKVYLLISRRTVSAGEHLAFALKVTHRATLIGDRTKGAGHVETDVTMPGGYVAVIPFGRAFDPRTGKGWERVGVQPDVRVPAEQALAAALKLAGVRKSAREALAGLR